MRSLYALHPETVLQLHERGAAVYGQPLTLSLAETEDRMRQEEYGRIVIDPGLIRSAEEQRALRRIEVVHPDAEIAWLRGRLPGRGDLALDDLAAELRGDAPQDEPSLAVVVAPGDQELAAVAALALATHLARRREALLVETDTSDPIYGRRLHLMPFLAQYMAGSRPSAAPGWPHRLRIVPAPGQPELLLEAGMEPLLDRLADARARSDVVVRASPNLADRGLIAALARASDILLPAAAGDRDYRRWLQSLAPAATLTNFTPVRGPLRPHLLARQGERIWLQRAEARAHAR